MAVDPIEEFWSVFSSTTGYRIDESQPGDHADVRLIDPEQSVSQRLCSDLDNDSSDDLTKSLADRNREPGSIAADNRIADNRIADGRVADNCIADDRVAVERQFPLPVGRTAAQRIATAGATIATELQRMREAILRSEGELAMRASTMAGGDVAEDLQTTLRELMSDAVAATGTTVAVLSMLDDDTETLRISSTHGLPPVAMTSPPRPLRGSRGDLEAMVNRVVLADGRSGSMETYCPPTIEGCPAMAVGICVVIRSADLPIGTLWLLTEQTHAPDGSAILFDNADAAAARLAAASIERTLAGSAKQTMGSTSSEQTFAAEIEQTMAIGQLASWQSMSLPAAASLTDRWMADGWIESDQSFITGWHTWDLLPDGTIMIAMADVDGATVTDALAAATARTALQSHSAYRHDPADMLSRISDTMWQSGAIVSPMSLFYAHLDPDTGAGVYCGAGAIAAIIGNRYGVRPLSSGVTDPIGIHIDHRHANVDFQMQPGETLLGYDSGLAGVADQTRLGRWMTDAMISGTKHPLAAIRRQLSNVEVSLPLGAITLMRSH